MIPALIFVSVIVGLVLICRDAIDAKLNRYRIERELQRLAPLAALSGKCDALLFSRYIIRISEAANEDDFTRARYLLDRLETRIAA